MEVFWKFVHFMSKSVHRIYIYYLNLVYHQVQEHVETFIIVWGVIIYYLKVITALKCFNYTIDGYFRFEFDFAACCPFEILNSDYFLRVIDHFMLFLVKLFSIWALLSLLLLFNFFVFMIPDAFLTKFSNNSLVVFPATDNEVDSTSNILWLRDNL